MLPTKDKDCANIHTYILKYIHIYEGHFNWKNMALVHS